MSVQGTTLAILQAYPLGTLEVQYWTDAYGGTHLRDRVIGLRADDRVMLDEGPDMKPSLLTPILRPFSALASPLEDGTVPAKEIAKLAWGLTGSTATIIDKAVVGYHHDHIRIETERGMFLTYIFREDWGVARTAADRNDRPLNQHRILDYLRSQHFAVGLEPGQFIPKD